MKIHEPNVVRGPVCRPWELIWERVAPSQTGVTQHGGRPELHVKLLSAPDNSMSF